MRLIDSLVRSIEFSADPEQAMRTLLETEWLVTNGLGGYASGSLAGVATRRYHGILVAALPNPIGRMVMLNYLSEHLTCDGRAVSLSGAAGGGVADSDVLRRIASTRLEAGLPVWEFVCEGVRIRKRVMMPHKQNSVHVTYQLVDGADGIGLSLAPSVHFRGYEERVDAVRNAPSTSRYRLATSGRLYVLTVEGDAPPLRLEVVGGEHAFTADERVTDELVYPVEQSRGYEFRGSLWAPGRFDIELRRGEPVTLVASTEPEEVMRALSPEEAFTCEMDRRRRLVAAAAPAARDGVGAELVLAADQFIITPAGRITDATRAAALGNEVRTIIAGYHWFTDWGRDTMISLEGLTLATGRQREANFILRTFAYYVRDGLIPNMFPDGSNEGLYHTADATLWFFHAAARYMRVSGDRAILQQLLNVFVGIVERHVSGTHYGIGLDPRDGLLSQGAPGYQLTWMDAKVDDWVVTPRRGKAVELNALWYNALRLLQGWLVEMRGEGASTWARDLADRAHDSFNRRFWSADRGYLFDVVDGEGGDSAECRPNQLLAIALDHPVLERAHWAPVLEVVRRRLLTPVGLRSLAPGEPSYKEHYFGDLRARDAAYHQGTVWGWLIGPWIDAWLRVHPDDRAGARGFLEGLVNDLDQFGLGTIGEIFDAEPPYTPRGCIAQAWSVAEALRCWVETAPDTTA